MADKDFHERLWALLNRLRESGTRLPEGLFSTLEPDFRTGHLLFSPQEYADPALRESLLDLVSRLGHFTRLSRETSRFIRLMLGDGPVLSLYSRFGEILFEFGAGTGIEMSGAMAEWSRLLARMGGLTVEIVEANPSSWSTKQQFERIVAVPPFGNRGTDEIALYKKLFALISDGGTMALVAPSSLLWGSGRHLKLRQAILERVHVAAVISLPPNAFQGLGIYTALVIIKTKGLSKTFMAASKGLTDLPAIAEGYHKWTKGNQVAIGFGAELEPADWSVSRYEPVDFEFGDLPFEYRIAPLSEIADIVAGKISDQAKVAINRTGSKVVWTADETKLIPKNNIFLTASELVNPSYLYLYLKSSTGKRALGRFVKGSVIPYIRSSEIGHLPIVLPSLLVQSKIVDDALELRKTVGALESLVTEGRQALNEKLFDLTAVNEKFRNFSEKIESAFIQTLPFPIAVVSRKVANAANHTQRFSLLIELFEVAVRFVALVNLADYINGRKQASTVAEQVPELKKLFAPALGDWVAIFRSFARMKASSESQPFLKEIRDFRLQRYQRTLQEFVDIRNASLRGHGATRSEEEYEIRFQEHAPKVYDLISSLGFLAQYILIKTGSMEKDGDFYKISGQRLMGDNPHFESVEFTLRTPLDSRRVLYLDRDSRSLSLDPLIVLERCSECSRFEVLLLDKISDRKITYLGYESGHRTVLPNADRLPSVIREIATRHEKPS